MHLPAQNYAAWQAMTLILHATGVLFTLYRLQERFRTSRLWWDDYIACVPLTFNIIFVVAAWMRLSVLRGLSGHEEVTPEEMSRPIHSYWMSLFLYFTVLWFSRISLALSLVRIYPKQDSRRRVAVIMIWIFAIIYVFAINVPIGTCPGITRPWYYVAMDRCMNERGIGYISGIVVFAFDVVADVVLILLPIYWLRRTDLKPRLRRIMVMAFCASFLSLLAAINYAIFYFSGIDFGVDRRLITAMIVHIQTGIAVIVCNFLVVITKLYRKANSNSDDDDDDDEGDSSYSDDVTSRRFRYGTDNLTVPASIISSTQDFVMRNLTNRHGNRRSRSNRHPYMMRPIAEDKQPSPFSSSSLPVIATPIEATMTVAVKATTSLPSAWTLENQNAPTPHDAQVATNQMSNSTMPTHDPSVAHTELGVQRPLSVHISTIKNHSKSAPG